MLALAVRLFVTVVERRERARDNVRRRVRRVEQRGERLDRLLLAQLAERLGGRLAQQAVLQQRHEPRRDPRVADLRQRVERGEGDEKVARLGDGGERLDGLDRAQLAERLDGVVAHVHVLVAERTQERVGGARVALLAERERGLDAQVRVRPLEEIDEGRERVHVAHRQDLERAVEQAQVVVVLAHGVEERVDGVGRGAARHAFDRRAAHAPALVLQRAEQRRRGVESFVRRQVLRRAQPHLLVGVGEPLGQVALAV